MVFPLLWLFLIKNDEIFALPRNFASLVDTLQKLVEKLLFGPDALLHVIVLTGDNCFLQQLKPLPVLVCIVSTTILHVKINMMYGVLE